MRHSFVSVPDCRCDVSVGFKLLPLWPSYKGLPPGTVSSNQPLYWVLSVLFVCLFVNLSNKNKARAGNLYWLSKYKLGKIPEEFWEFSLSRVCSTQHRQEAGGFPSVPITRSQKGSSPRCSGLSRVLWVEQRNVVWPQYPRADKTYNCKRTASSCLQLWIQKTDVTGPCFL